MHKTTTIIITVIAILTYIIIRLLINRFINSKIIVKANRKKYKKYLNRDLGALLAPLLFLPVIVGVIVKSSLDTSQMSKVNVWLQVFLLLTQIVLSVFVWRKLRYDIIKLKTFSENEIMKQIEK